MGLELGVSYMLILGVSFNYDHTWILLGQHQWAWQAMNPERMTGWWFQPLWKITMGRIIPYIMEKETCLKPPARWKYIMYVWKNKALRFCGWFSGPGFTRVCPCRLCVLSRSVKCHTLRGTFVGKVCRAKCIVRVPTQSLETTHI